MEVAATDPQMANVLLKTEILDTLWAPNSPPSFNASASMVNFEHIRAENNIFSQIDTPLDNSNEDLDVCFHQPEKKRRLLPDQVKFLEKSFEVENKLEPERKLQLAKELGLQPRQVAIWFQNRRARYKTKLLEKEYDSLKASYDKLKQDYDSLYQENEKTKLEINYLTEKLLKPDPINGADGSAKSDVVDSDSPHCGNDNHSGLLLSDSYNSDYDEEDDKKTPLCFPKLEDKYYDDDDGDDDKEDDLQPNSCNLGFPVMDQGTWFWKF